MADIVEVSEAVRDRLSPALPDWNTFWFEPSPIPTPALCIKPDPQRFADYQQVMGAYTKWHLRIAFYLPANDQEASHRMMAALTDPKGLVIATLRSDDIDDALADLCRGDVEPTTGRGWGVVRRNRSRYLSADIGICCGAN